MASATGSAGTIASGDYMKEQFPGSLICASEALQCPTLLNNGFGAHRIEGIGDKHVPWVHNVKNTDMVVAIDDAAPVAIMRLFNEDAGREYLAAAGRVGRPDRPAARPGHLRHLNVLSAIKMAKYYEMGPNDVVMTIATDSMEMYQPRRRVPRAGRRVHAAGRRRRLPPLPAWARTRTTCWS
jgi:cysteine synthase A